MQTDGHFSTAILGGELPISLKNGLILVLLAPDMQEEASGDRLSSCRKMFGVNFLHFIMRTLSHETYIKAIRRFYHLVFDT